jgi:two-component system, response regulator YesN
VVVYPALGYHIDAVFVFEAVDRRARLSKGKVLVVDDERSVRETMSLILDAYEVMTVSTGEDALAILNRPTDIDIVVVDVVLPGIRGIELLEEIKKRDSRLKVVIMTSYCSNDIIVEALRLHADDYVEKPFNVEQMKKVIDRLADAKMPNFPEGKIGTVVSILRKNFATSIRLKDTADTVFLHPTYLSRAFKVKVGKTFNAYKASLRIAEAKSLLVNTQESIHKISYRLGYHNPESFMKMFKKMEDCTPSQYRLRHLKNKPISR